LEVWELQWGRDQLIAEFHCRRLAVSGVVELQWGRDQLIAELAFFKNTLGLITFASMGPRSADRGIPLSVVPCPTRPCTLQWGRDQLIAEF